MVARATTLNQESFTHPPPSFVLMAWAIKNSQRCFAVMACAITYPQPPFVLMAWAIKNSQRCFTVMA